MKLRSMLFVPGDSERKFAKAVSSGADALILDLEDAVAASQKPVARSQVAEWIEAAGTREYALFVRVNALPTGLTSDDLAAVVRPGLDGILLPKAAGAHDVLRLDEMMSRLERERGLPVGNVRIAVVATETPAAMFALGSYAPPHPRLAAMTWGAEDLAAAIGATSKRDASGAWTAPYQHARTMCLFAAAAAEVSAIETLYADFRDLDGLERDCRQSRQDGFVGRIAIHPDQVEPINRAYSPSPDEISDARRLIAAFDAQPNAGTIGLDGKMFDIPHLIAAQRLLARVDP